MHWPKYLYRYRPGNAQYTEDEIKAIGASKIYLPSASFLNDPFDCNPAVIASKPRDLAQEIKIFGIQRYKEYRLSRLKKSGLRPDHQTMRKLKKLHGDPVKAALLEEKLLRKLPFAYRQDDLRIACFSESPDSVLMWSHYASGHTGFLVKYLLDDKDWHGDVDLPLKVKYSFSRQNISTLRLFKYGMREFYESDEFNDVFEAMTLSKSDVWSYEKEWRLIGFAREGEGYKALRNLIPVQIVLGVNASEDLAASIKLHLPNILATRAKVSPMEYRILLGDNE